jgi:hypothetical protein
MNISCIIEFWSFFNCFNFRIILPTAVIPSPETNRLNRQVSVNQSDQLSANDVIPGSLSPERHVMRGKRYFILSVTSTTVTTYSITSTAVTKSVRLAGDMQVLCLPSGYIVCWTLISYILYTVLNLSNFLIRIFRDSYGLLIATTLTGNGQKKKKKKQFENVNFQCNNNKLIDLSDYYRWPLFAQLVALHSWKG